MGLSHSRLLNLIGFFSSLGFAGEPVTGACAIFYCWGYQRALTKGVVGLRCQREEKPGAAIFKLAGRGSLSATLSLYFGLPVY